MSFIVVTYGWAAFGLESDSSAYIGIFPLVLDWSWMCKCRPFPISKWRNLIRLTLCLGTPSPTHRQPIAKLVQPIKRDVNLVPHFIERHRVLVRVNDMLDVLVVVVPLDRVALLNLNFVNLLFRPKAIKMRPIDV
jgi:hypothetical protein